MPSSRLKPVPLRAIACIRWDWRWNALDLVGLALAGKALGVTLQN
jgi:hypothetical protein